MKDSVKEQIKEMGLTQSYVFDVYIEGLNKYSKRSVYIDTLRHKYYIVFMGRLMEVKSNESEWRVGNSNRYVTLRNFHTVEKVSRYEYDEWKNR